MSFSGSNEIESNAYLSFWPSLFVQVVGEVAKVGRHSDAVFRKRTTRVDKRDRKGLPTKVFYRYLFVVLIGQKKIGNFVTDLGEVLVDWQFRLPGFGGGTDADVFDPVGFFARIVHDEIALYFGAGGQVVPNPIRMDREVHRHCGHVALDRFVIDLSRLCSLVDRDDLALERISLGVRRRS